MRFNENAMKQLSKQGNCDKEGRLDYKAPRDSYKERWFRLKGNLLFYYKTNNLGYLTDSEAVGVMVLENISVQMEPMVQDRSFVFSIGFEGEGDRRHYFGGQSVHVCQDWIRALKKAGIELIKSKIMVLQAKIQQRTGKDPIEDLYDKKFKQDKNKAQRHSYEAPKTPIQRPEHKVKSAELLLDPFSLKGWETFE